MSGGKLTALQWRILQLLSDLQPPWTLTGGAALAGVYLKHRTTRDLDLFWHDRDRLGSLVDEARDRLTGAGLEVSSLQAGGTFSRLRVEKGGEVCLVDFVADPVPALERPHRIEIEGASIIVDTLHEILVNKLCALLGRAEIRDLVDVRALLDAGADLKRALGDAPRKDGGFSPLVLAWVLRDLRPEALAPVSDLTEEQAAELARFRDRLVLDLLEAGAPL